MSNEFEVVSEDEIDGDDDVNVIVATKVIEDKAKEAGTHTVAPLLKVATEEEETKESVQVVQKPKSMSVSTNMLKRAKKARDRALKDILSFEGRYNLKFLAAWT
jgi:Ni,Fe-hydrogenase maturation factor